MFRVLHTGDLHLDSPFRSLPLPESEACRDLQIESFLRLVDYAKSEKIDLVLIAGDLVDSNSVRPDVLSRICDALGSLPCPVVIAPGNHDPYKRGSLYLSPDLPENVFVFTSESIQRFSFPDIAGGVDVFGYAFMSDRLEASPLSGLPDQFCLTDGVSILLCHGDLDAPLSKYAPILSHDIARLGIDYAALGHIHNTGDELLLFGDARAAYCGFAEGRSFDECGFGSFRVLTFDENRTSENPLLSAERVTLARHRYEISHLDVTGCNSDAELLSQIRTHVTAQGFCDDTSLRLILEGAVSPDYTPKTAFLDAEFQAIRSSTREFPRTIELLDHTLPIFEAEHLEKDPTLRGELYRTLKEQMLSGTPEDRATAAAALRLGLAAIDGRALM